MTTKTAQFTPGPYELRGPRLLTDSNGVVLADNIGANWPGTIDGQANLFTAAPAMYEALQQAQELIRSLVAEDMIHTTELQRVGNCQANMWSALAKAEGR